MTSWLLSLPASTWWYRTSALLLLLLPVHYSKAANTVLSPEQSYQHRLQEIERQLQHQPQFTTLWLNTSDAKYLAIQRKHLTPKSNGVVIVTHNIQQHPAWPGLVESMLDTFPRYGWDVLSVAMPFVATEQLAREDTAQERQRKLFECLSQAFAQARQSDPEQIVLMLQGGYVDDVLSLFQQYQQQPDGLILVSNPLIEHQQVNADLAPLRPALLDVLVSNTWYDIEPILAQRRQKNSHKYYLYRQIEWPETQLNVLQSQALAQYAAGWLASLSKGRLQRNYWRGQTW